jgi:hypothetical protein
MVQSSIAVVSCSSFFGGFQSADGKAEGGGAGLGCRPKKKRIRQQREGGGRYIEGLPWSKTNVARFKVAAAALAAFPVKSTVWTSTSSGAASDGNCRDPSAGRRLFRCRHCQSLVATVQIGHRHLHRREMSRQSRDCRGEL